jgi:hypothetical protein
MNESVQKIVTDLIQRQSCCGGFLPTGPAVLLPESEVGTAVSAFIWSMVGHVADGKTGNYLRTECIGNSAAQNAPCGLLPLLDSVIPNCDLCADEHGSANLDVAPSNRVLN